MTASPEAIAIEPLSTRRQLELLRDLQRLANERAQEEQRIRTALVEGLRTAEEARDQAAAEIARQFSSRREKASAEYEQVTGNARRRYEEVRNAAQQEYKGLRHGVESEVSRVTEAARDEQQQKSWEALTVFDALKGRPRERFLESVKQLERINQELAVLEHDAIEIMKMRRQWREFPAEASSNSGQRAGSSPTPAELTSAVRDAVLALHRQKLPRVFEGGWPFGVFVLILAIAIVPSGIVLGWAGWQWIAASGVLAVVATAALLILMRPVALRGEWTAVSKSSGTIGRRAASSANRAGRGPRARPARSPSACQRARRTTHRGRTEVACRRRRARAVERNRDRPCGADVSPAARRDAQRVGRDASIGQTKTQHGARAGNRRTRSPRGRKSQ